MIKAPVRLDQQLQAAVRRIAQTPERVFLKPHAWDRVDQRVYFDNYGASGLTKDDVLHVLGHGFVQYDKVKPHDKYPDLLTVLIGECNLNGGWNREVLVFVPTPVEEADCLWVRTVQLEVYR